jgi:5'-methylthioadenosine phosphorylase
MKTVHILANPEDIAKRVVIAGDPARVKQLAGMLKEVKLVNSNRGYLTYTGYYNSIPITIATHGVGAPSLAIVVEELRILGAEIIVRLGTTGAMVKEIDIGDIIIPTGAAYPYGGNTTSMYSPNGCMAAVPDPFLLRKFMENCEKFGIKYFAGPIFSSDAFYAEDPKFIEKWSSRGIIAIEMECAALFILGLIRKFKSGAILVVSNNLTKSEEESKLMATAEEIKKYVEKAFMVILETITNI